ncbi:MAG: methyltransferase domain-containing protein [Candidatus Uhrbacteria bacterium]
MRNPISSRPRRTEFWRTSLWRVPEEAGIKQALVLGIGDGGSIREIRRRFKHAHVTVVDQDPSAIESAKSRRAFSAKNPPEIVVGDPIERVRTLGRSFDLVVVDLAANGEPDPRLASEETVASLAAVLESDGYLVLSVLASVGIIPAFEKILSRHASWHFKSDVLALFRHNGQGRVGEPVPEGFVHQMQSPDYLLGGWPADAKNTELVGKPGCWGMRWHYGPAWIEAYTSDVQPDIDAKAHSRMVIWQPITKLGKPAGWGRSWIQMNPQQHGFADIKDKPEYWKEWTGHAQRHLKKWLKDDRYETVEVSYEDFATAYNKTGKLPSMRKDFLKLLQRRMDRHGQNVRLFASRDKATKEILSGLAVCDLPDVSVSMHLIAFIQKKYEKTSVGTGIIDHWYRNCQSTGIRFPHFGLVWAPGDPNSWKGYSKFKRQFNLHLLRYPMPLLKFVKQKPKG